MQNQQSHSSKSKAVTTKAFSVASNHDANMPTLDQFVSFMKKNWRPLVMEAVAAGVTAYLTYSHDGRKPKSAPGTSRAS